MESGKAGSGFRKFDLVERDYFILHYHVSGTKGMFF
jgi:hypothetical protein